MISGFLASEVTKLERHHRFTYKGQGVKDFAIHRYQQYTYQQLTMLLISCFVLFCSINPSSANSKSPCSYPTQIKFFIPHTITIFIFSANDKYPFPPFPPFPPSPSINQHFLHFSDYSTTKKQLPMHINSNYNHNNISMAMPSNATIYEIPSESQILSHAFHPNLTKTHIHRTIQIQNTLSLSTYYAKSLFHTLTTSTTKLVVYFKVIWLFACPFTVSSSPQGHMKMSLSASLLSSCAHSLI